MCCCAAGFISCWITDGVRASMVSVGYYFSCLFIMYFSSYVGPARIGISGVPTILPLAYNEASAAFMYFAVLARKFR